MIILDLTMWTCGTLTEIVVQEQLGVLRFWTSRRSAVCLNLQATKETLSVNMRHKRDACDMIIGNECGSTTRFILEAGVNSRSRRSAE